MNPKTVIKGKIHYVGVNDRNKHLFEGMWPLPYGVSYNSYLIDDETVALIDTVDICYFEVYLRKIKSIIGERPIQYLIINHMEPDHSGSIRLIKQHYPDIIIVGNKQTFGMIEGFYGVTGEQYMVKDEDFLALGHHKLRFYMTPMVHWPEVMVTYESKEIVLFSADGFGIFGAYDTDEDWACEARRYYFGIVGKFGVQVQNLLKKAATLDIEKICPLHGPVLTENLSYYLNLYDIWSSYRSETKGVCICYTSVYGNTEKAANQLAEKLKQKGCEKTAINDLARCDMAEAVEDAFRYDRLVLATTTYNSDIFPFMKEFIEHLTERNFQNKTIALIENGSWAPTAAKIMRDKFEKSKNIIFTEQTVKIISALNDENEEQLEALACELCGK